MSSWFNVSICRPAAGIAVSRHRTGSRGRSVCHDRHSAGKDTTLDLKTAARPRQNSPAPPFPARRLWPSRGSPPAQSRQKPGQNRKAGPLPSPRNRIRRQVLRKSHTRIMKPRRHAICYPTLTILPYQHTARSPAHAMQSQRHIQSAPTLSAPSLRRNPRLQSDATRAFSPAQPVPSSGATCTFLRRNPYLPPA